MKNLPLKFICYLLVLSGIPASAWGIGKLFQTQSVSAPLNEPVCFIIDAGHGGEDGGAVSCTGVKESELNLSISKRLSDLMSLLGMHSVMTRTDENAISTQGDTIAQRKRSDLQQRVRIVNSQQNGILLSIHQNHYSQSQYRGGQMFYNPQPGAQELAQQLQQALKEHLDPANNRKAAPVKGIYLMQHIHFPGILIECGFLSNLQEEALLRNEAYQKKLCCVIAAVCSRFPSENIQVT